MVRDYGLPGSAANCQKMTGCQGHLADKNICARGSAWIHVTADPLLGRKFFDRFNTRLKVLTYDGT